MVIWQLTAIIYMRALRIQARLETVPACSEWESLSRPKPRKILARVWQHS